MRYLKFLDGLRCISIGWVMLLHLPFDKAGAFGLLASRGWMGVDMFFVISGFLITSLLLAERGDTGRINLGHFYMRRTLRIWPAYYLLIVITLVAGVVLRSNPTLLPYVSADRIMRTIGWPATYLTNAYVAYNGTEDVTLLHSWSLALEEQFYLLWPAILILAGRRALHVVIVAIVAITLWRISLVPHFAAGIPAMRRIYYAPDTRMDVLLYGVLAAFLVRSAALKATLTRWLGQRWVPFALGLAFAFLIYVSNRWSGRFTNSVGYGASAAVMACLLTWLVVVRPARVIAWLESRPLVYVGKISYGIYLYQLAVIDALEYFAGVPLSILGKVAFTLAAYALSIAVATLSYRYFESPILKLKSRFAAGHRPPASPTLPEIGAQRG